MGIPRYAVSSVALWLALTTAWAQTPAATEPTEALDEVLVSGEYPGPGLWKVTRADDAGHVMWIVGEPPPLPKRMKWKSKDVEAVALSAQEILLDSAVRMDADEKIGFFRGMTLLPAMLEARRNPRTPNWKTCSRHSTRAGSCRRSSTSVVKAVSKAGARCLRRSSCARPPSTT